MAETTNLEDSFDQAFEESNNLPEKISDKIVTQSSAKVDESVRTVEDKVRYWQDAINHWRITITQNEKAIQIFCVIFGICFSYAINECTGNLDLPVYAYILTGIIIILISLLLITEGSLPLIVLVKFGVLIAFGHVSMMWAVAIDGHYWHLFTTETCRYPLTTDSFMVFLVGGGAGYIFKSFEEIRAAGKES